MTALGIAPENASGDLPAQLFVQVYSELRRIARSKK